MSSTGQSDDACDVFDLTTLDLPVFHFMVSMRKEFPHRREARSPVRAGNCSLRIQAVLNGPLTPDSFDGRRRIDQHTIEVEKESFAVHFNHDLVGCPVTAFLRGLFL